MPKPDNIRCETCVFWVPSYPEDQDDNDGECHLATEIQRKAGIDFCGEWRDTWPTSHTVTPSHPPLTCSVCRSAVPNPHGISIDPACVLCTKCFSENDPC